MREYHHNLAIPGASGPRAELQAHRLQWVIDGWSFPPDGADPGREGRAAMPGGPRSLPSRTALKQLICGQPQQESHALGQVRWVIARFRDAGEPAWAAPDEVT